MLHPRVIDAKALNEAKDDMLKPNIMRVASTDTLLDCAVEGNANLANGVETPKGVALNDSSIGVRGKVRALLTEILARADDIEAGCTVPADLLDKLEKAGAFRMCLPRMFGGEELPLSVACGVIEDVAGADASVAWHLMVAAGAQVITSRLPIETLWTYYADGPDTWSKGATAPKGVAVPVEGGYRLSGRWPLASGARPYKWINLGFFVKDEEGIRKAPNGAPDFRMCLVPRELVTVIETWDAVGLRGTRSDDLEVKDIFVPEAWQASLFGPSQIQAPTLGIRMPFATGPHHSAIHIGILRGALYDLATTALTRRPAFNPSTIMKNDPVFRSRFGEVAAKVELLAHAAQGCIGILEQCDREGRDVTTAEGASLGAVKALIAHEASGVMDQIMALSGSGGIYMSNRTQRRWRDLRCAAQHQAVNIGQYNDYAASLIARAEAEDRVIVSPPSP